MSDDLAFAPLMERWVDGSEAGLRRALHWLHLARINYGSELRRGFVTRDEYDAMLARLEYTEEWVKKRHGELAR